MHLYGDTIKDSICQRLMNGESLNQICKDDGYPPESTVRTWVYEGKDVEFVTNYRRARQIQAERFAEEIIEIADRTENDFHTVYNDDGSVKKRTSNHGSIERDRLRVETRKWVLSKILPHTYGDKLQVSGSQGLTINIVRSEVPVLPEPSVDAEFTDLE